MSDQRYPEHPRSTVNRYKGRAVYDFETIHSLVDTSPILHVSFVPSPIDEFPTILPMIGAMGSFSSPSDPLSAGPLDLYLHGYVSSRLMRLPPDDNSEEGVPVCIAATHLDGLVLALTPNHHSMNYRSAVLHGYANLVTSPEEKLYALELITDNLIPSRWENTRIPPNKVEMQSTSILRVSIVSASAKVRNGGPGEDKKDESDETVRGKVWTGVVPVWSTLGEPVPAEHNKVEIPAHVKDLVEVWNTDGERIATEAVKAGKH